MGLVLIGIIEENIRRRRPRLRYSNHITMEDQGIITRTGKNLDEGQQQGGHRICCIPFIKSETKDKKTIYK